MEVNLLVAAYSGLIGALILTVLIYILKWSGQKLDIPFLIGSRFIDVENRGKVYLVGNILHLLIGVGWGVLYVVLLTGLRIEPNWAAGILWGFAHGIFLGVMMGIISENHPQIGEGKPIEDPGILGRNWGPKIPYWILILHIIYGVSTLSIYHSVVFG